ncbi:ABC transporter permease [Acrocarpospora corrugata]|uniref:ABC transporter permease n=1 Tax=Acrocarpospora corrugata TaxID=35763 RepID=A0A5M3WAC4_9ACTN|nr:ABC transporter permease [Acrocarpospora corrugata]GES05756.1 ABC transporter permease [Acrocarpospora corrugata]
MLRYSLRRTLHSLIVLVGVLVLVFLVVDRIGDPARLMLPADAPIQVYLDLRAKLGLDEPFFDRFWSTVSGWFVGDFGDSLWQGVPALGLALSRVPVTLSLTFASLVVAIPLALLLGTRSAIKPGSLADRFLTTVSLTAVSIADFWLGLMLILIFSVQFAILPTSGFGGLEYLILPAATLTLRPIGRIAQIVRSALVEEMQKPYIRTLRAKGLTEGQIVRKHALKNSAIPIVTVAGDEIATFLNGAVVIETIFAWPGIGTLFIGAIERRDLPMIEACVFVVAIMVIAVNLLVDLTYARLDPRAKIYD